jgi:REP element-mobilizing transposase RayT
MKKERSNLMAHTYYKIWVHIIWSTKNRQPLLNKELRPQLFEHIREKAKEEGYHLDFINGVEDHVHSLFSLNPKFAISEVANKIKGESSHWINSGEFLKTKFAWQQGYAAFSVSESAVVKVREYIKNQEEHHRKMAFREEVEGLLRLHRIEFNPSDL